MTITDTPSTALAGVNRLRVKDWLLTATKGICWFAMGLVTLIGVALTLVAIFVVAKSDMVIAEMVKEHGSADISTVFFVVMAIVGAIGVMVAAFYFLRNLLGIVKSVEAGEPFAAANAKRLRTMGWITTAWFVAQFTLVPFASLIAESIPGKVNIDGGGIELDSLLTALVLFVLARVFEHGNRLADEAEGTV